MDDLTAKVRSPAKETIEMYSNDTTPALQQWPPDLRSENADYLWARGVTPEVARARGYRSVRGGTRNIDESTAAAYRLGTKPGLLIPLHPLLGDQQHYQIRLDDPDPDGPKFRTPAGDPNVLSTSPLTRDAIATAPIIGILEGVTRVDALAVYGIPAVGINGCWGWRSRGVVLPDFELIDFRDKVVFVGFDADALTNEDVNQALARFAPILRRRGAKRVLLLRVPLGDDDKVRGLDDWLAAERFETAEQVWAALHSNCSDTLDLDPLEDHDSPAGRYRNRDRTLPDVYAGDDSVVFQQSEIQAAYREGNREADTDRVYNFHGDLARVVDTRLGTVIRPLKADAYRYIVSRYVNFWRWQNKHRILCRPPMSVMSSVFQLGVTDEPELHGLATYPFLSPDGTELITEPGYHLESGIYLTDYPQSPPLTAAEAVKALDDVFQDFPLETDHDRAGLYAMMLTPIVRRALPTAPFLLVTKPQPREGASLMTELLATIIMGRGFASIAVADKQTEVDESLRKSIATAALDPAGRRLWRFDNMPGTFSSPTFAEFLTDTDFSTRRLGTNDAVFMPPGGVTVYGTTNSIEVSQELVARCYEIRINSGTPNPARRTGFRYPNVRDHVRQHRPVLLSAVVSLVRAWLDAGSPRTSRPVGMGGFEDWADMMAAILAHAGIDGFLTQAERLAARAATEGNDETAFVQRWWEQHQGNVVTTRQLFDLNKVDDADLIPVRGKEEAGQRRSLGQTISKMVDRTFDIDAGWATIERLGGSRGVTTYRLKLAVAECRMPDCHRPAGPDGFCSECA